MVSRPSLKWRVGVDCRCDCGRLRRIIEVVRSPPLVRLRVTISPRDLLDRGVAVGPKDEKPGQGWPEDQKTKSQARDGQRTKRRTSRPGMARGPKDEQGVDLAFISA